MKISIDTVGKGHINDGKSTLRLTLTSDSADTRQLILSVAALLTAQGSDCDAAVVAQYFGITHEEVEIAVSKETV